MGAGVKVTWGETRVGEMYTLYGFLQQGHDVCVVVNHNDELVTLLVLDVSDIVYRRVGEPVYNSLSERIHL